MSDPDHDFSWVGDLLEDLVEALLESPRILLIALVLIATVGIAYAVWG